MNVLVAIDSFKGSLSSMEAGTAVAEGIKKANEHAAVVVCTVADGGEGTTSALIEGIGGRYVEARVTGPLGDKVDCVYGILGDGRTAVIEMSIAAGLPLVPIDKRNPFKTTTYGVGELILDAVQKGCRHFIVGIGGSATNDGGIGMLQALGFQFLDKKGKEICFGAEGMEALAHITGDKVVSEIKACTFRVACDVNNPLYGESGASAVYGPQKGASPEMIVTMDHWLKKYADMAEEAGYFSEPAYAGAGAAGGMGYAFRTFLNATLESGVKIILEETNLESYIQKADIVVTGEGRLDAQTVMGKAPIGVAALAKRYDKTVIAFSGCVTDEAGVCNEAGIDAFFPILRNIQSREEAMESASARKNLRETSEQVFRLINNIRR